MLLLLSRFSCVRLCATHRHSPPGSPVPGILQARALEGVALKIKSVDKYATVLFTSYVT